MDLRLTVFQNMHSLIAPTWKDTSKGTGSVYVDRSGVLFLEFASINANAPQQACALKVKCHSQLNLPSGT